MCDEIVIVGAGLIGLSIAFELLLMGEKVRVLDMHDVGAGASASGGGLVSPASEAEHASAAMLKFAAKNMKAYDAFLKKIEDVSCCTILQKKTGTILTCSHQHDTHEFERVIATICKHAFHFERLSASDVFTLEPHVSTRICSGVLLPDDFHVEPGSLLHALYRAVLRLGGIIETGVRVEQIRTLHDEIKGVVIRHASGEQLGMYAKRVVMCSGAWSTQSMLLPLLHFEIYPMKGQLLELKGKLHLTRAIRTPDVYVLPRDNDTIVLGATSEDVGFDVKPTAGAALELLRHASYVCPSIYDLEMVKMHVGLRSYTLDYEPVLGATDIQGLFVAVGHYRYGFTLLPCTAKYMALTIVQNKTHEELTCFSSERFSQKKSDHRVA